MDNIDPSEIMYEVKYLNRKLNLVLLCIFTVIVLPVLAVVIERIKALL